MYLMHSQMNPFATALSTTQVVKGSVQGSASHGSVIKSGFVVASSVVVVVLSVVVVGFSVVVVVDIFALTLIEYFATLTLFLFTNSYVLRLF